MNEDVIALFRELGLIGGKVPQPVDICGAGLVELGPLATGQEGEGKDH